jgi:hypothetical protein
MDHDDFGARRLCQECANDGTSHLAGAAGDQDAKCSAAMLAGHRRHFNLATIVFANAIRPGFILSALLSEGTPIWIVK